MTTEVKARKTFAHGVHPPECKEATENTAIQPFPLPPTVFVPLSQHIGAPAKALVEKGQAVQRGEKIADAGGFISVPMHAPVAGKVQKIDKTMSANGRMVDTIIIQADPEASQDPVSGEVRSLDTIGGKEIVSAVQSTGMVGLGGAAFPSHVKMAVPEGKSVDTVIANGCECEPYLTCDNRVMLEQKEDLIAGLQLAMRATGAQRGIIGIESNKPEAIRTLRQAIPQGTPITVEAVKTKYPQGAEKVLIKAVLNREVPSGGLPADAGAAVFNVATLAQIAQLLPQSRGIIERVVTVTGSGVERPGNYMIPLGAQLSFVLEHVGLKASARQIIMGGPMMGPSVYSLDLPVTKGVSGILVLSEDEVKARPDKVYPCIRCGSCVSVCPLYLNPQRLGQLARSGEYARMESKYHLNDCFECGSCTFVCPSNIPLVHYFRVAKATNRERKASK